jgi:uncharacterized membrane protein YdfJ with MMPL/SSD domain
MDNKPTIPIPPANIVVSANPTDECPITDTDLHQIYSEILDDIRNDRREINSLLNNFTEMVMNEGDGSSASKEAIVNLIKTKSDLSDKKTKIADLMTSLRIKDKSLLKNSTNQTNHIHITDKRNLIESLTTKYKKEKSDG